MGLGEANIRLMEAKGDAKAERAALNQINYEKCELTRNKTVDSAYSIIEGVKIDPWISTDYRSIEGMSALVFSIAKKMAKGNGADVEELKSEGYVGLTLAIQSFDPDTSSLATHATTCIENAILSYLRKQQRWDKTELWDNIAETVLDTVPDAEERLVFKQAVEEANKKVASILSDLTEREQYVLYNYIISDDPERAEDIGDQFQCSKYSIYRDINRVKEMLREDS